MTIVTKTVINPKSGVQSLPTEDDTCTVCVDVNSEGHTTSKPLFFKVCGISVINFLYMLAFLILVMYALYMYGAFVTSSDDNTEKYFTGVAEIPMPQYQDLDAFVDNERFAIPADSNIDKILSQIFREFIEIDLKNESFEKIDVPDFKGMKGRFIHDFNFNLTAIIDPSSGRCFIMPLNRSAILPPKSLRDAITKMEQGYYEVDMSVVKQNYRAVIPSVFDVNELGMYISRECRNMPTYHLEKINRELFKRSTGGKKAVFTQYGGKVFQKFVISNIKEVEDYEKRI